TTATSSSRCWSPRTWSATSSASSRRLVPSTATRPTRRRRGPEMGKQSAGRRLDETEAKAYLHVLRTSPRKLNLVAQTIRGKNASSALAELTFSPRRIARDVKKVL